MDRYYTAGTQVNGYMIIRELGEGRYGIVYLAKNRQGKKCVIKQLKKEMLYSTRKKLFYEQEILQSLNHPCFPRFIERFMDDDVEGYVLEYISGTAFDNLIRKQHYQFEKWEIYDIADQLLDLLDILHSKNIVHRDIRLPNVILRPNGNLALIDFGLARYISPHKYRKETDYWYLGDFLIHLLYTSYCISPHNHLPWYENLSLSKRELHFLKKLMGIDRVYRNTSEVSYDLEKLQRMF